MNTTPPASSTDLHVVLGSGPAGTALASELARHGHRVRLVNRSGLGEDISGVERMAADVSDTTQAGRAVEGACVVYHCVNVPYADQVALMPGIQTSILSAVEAAGARLVVLDTVYPYGRTHGAVMTEETPWAATTRKGRMRAELDRRYLGAHTSGRVSVSLGRAADFVGPGVLSSTLGGGVFPGALTGGEIYVLGDIDLLHSFTSIFDVATGLRTLGEHPEADGQVWHLPTAAATSTREVLSMIEDRVDRPLNVIEVREPRPFGPFDEIFVAEYAEMFYQHTEAQVFDSSKFEHRFAVTPMTLAETLTRTVDWFGTSMLSR